MSGHPNQGNVKSSERCVQFHVEHIASFNASASPKHTSNSTPVTLMSPDEAMRRLRHLSQRQGVWPTRATLAVNKRHLSVIDPVTGLAMEKFSITHIYRPTVVSTAPGDPYENVAVITVLGDSRQQTAPEIHMFQCIEQTAQELVDAILEAASKKQTISETSWKEDSINDDSSPTQLLESEQTSQRTVEAVSMYERSLSEKQRDQRPRHPDSLTKDCIVIKSVEILNRCFDEIERFMNRLQSITDAFKELEKRRRFRKKKNPVTGDGILSLRARNPPEKDFIDVLQKFKLSFNLLARLKCHIHDPNSPELVHFLFTPLSLVIEASKDVHQSASLVSTIVVPPLTNSAVELLGNCLTSKEMELWLSLGDAWTKSGDKCPGTTAFYQPRFTDGYEPDPVYWSDVSVEERVLSRTRQLSLDEHGFEKDNESRSRASFVRSPITTQFVRAPSPTINDLVKLELRTSWSTGCVSKNHEVVRHNSETRSSGSSQPVSDSRPVFLRQYSAPLVKSKPFRSSAAMRDYEAQFEFLLSLRTRQANVHQVVKSYESQSSAELSVFKGDIVEVIDDRRNWWRVRTYQSHVGLVPYDILQTYSI